MATALVIGAIILALCTVAVLLITERTFKREEQLRTKERKQSRRNK